MILITNIKMHFKIIDQSTYYIDYSQKPFHDIAKNIQNIQKIS